MERILVTRMPIYLFLTKMAWLYRTVLSSQTTPFLLNWASRRLLINRFVFCPFQLKFIPVNNFHKPLPELFANGYAFVSNKNMVIFYFTKLFIVDDV